MADIQLLINDDANREALSSVVQERHTPIETAEVTGADVHIVDDASLPEYRDAIEEHTRCAAPVFCPVVLVKREHTAIRIDLPTPETGQRSSIVNEVLKAPVNKRVLFRRLGNLLDLRRQTESLQKKNQRLDKLASVVSHDLRNPLRVAQGRLELATMENADANLEEVEDALNRMENLIADLLTIAQQDADITDTEVFELQSVVDDAWQTVATPQAVLDTDARVRIEGDRSRCRQLLENLFRNAIDHGGEDVTITAGALENGFYVSDDGPGISEEDRGDVFEFGYTEDEDGTGFGLAIVKEIASAHDWEVTVTDGQAGGAKFVFTGLDSSNE